MKWWKILLFITLIIVTCWFIYTYFRTNIPVDEGFQSTPGIVSEAILHPSSVTGADTSTTYTIFDPTAAYVQAQMYETEYTQAFFDYFKSESELIDRYILKEPIYIFKCHDSDLTKYRHRNAGRAGCNYFPEIQNCRDDGTSLWEDLKCQTWCGSNANSIMPG
jgi:hypothetical protein